MNLPRRGGSGDDPDSGERVPRFVSFLTATLDTQQAALVANVGWMLAGAGADVLVLDWQPERPEVEAYLGRCPAWQLDESMLGEPVSEALRRAFPEVARPAEGATRVWPVGRWWRHDMDGLDGLLDVATFTDFAPGEGQATPRPRTDQMQRLCRILKNGCRYHYVLMRGPGQGADDSADIASGSAVADRVANAVVVRVAHSPDLFRDAQRLVTDPLADGLDVIAVAADWDSARVGNVEATVRSLLAGAQGNSSDGPGRTLSVAEMPYDPYDRDAAAGKVLAVLLDGDRELGLAYQHVSGLVAGTQGSPVVTQLPQQMRDHYAWSLGREGRTAPRTRWIAYTPRERIQAERIATWLRDAGVPVRGLPLTSRAEGIPEREDVVLAIRSADVGADDPRVPADAVWISTTDTDPSARTDRWIDLSTVPPDGHRATVLSGLGLFHDSSPADRRSPPPGAAEVKPRMPVHDQRFVGRGELLEEIRDAFAPLAGPSAAVSGQPVVLVGEPGVGKSGVAIEDAHRFADAYAGVFWVAAQDLPSVRGALADLTHRQGWKTPRDAADAALDHFRMSAWDQPWLLVFDNVATGVLNDLNLDNVGDVIVTATDRSSPEPGTTQWTTLRVERLEMHESWEILRQDGVGVPGLTDAQASAVVKAIGGLPVPLTIAAAFLREAVRELQRTVVADEARILAVENLCEKLGDCPPESSSVLSRMLAVACEAISDTSIGKLAVTLAEMCVFLAPDGVDLEMIIRSRAMTAQLAVQAGPAGRSLLEDEWELERVLAAGARFGLFDVDWGPQTSLRMHRVLQLGMRELLKSDDLHARQAAVLRALAELAPLRTDSPAAKSMFAELQRHFSASKVLDVDLAGLELGPPTEPGSPAWTVRRWVVEQVSFVRRTGERADWEKARKLVAAVESRWTAAFGRDDPLCRRLVGQRGALMFELGDHAEAGAVDEQVLAEYRRSLGDDHPRSLRSAQGLAGDLQRIGRFDEAYIEQMTVWLRFREALGEDHPDTLAAGNNLAVSQFLTGRHADALQLQRDCHAHRARVLGEEHPWYLASLRDLGIYLCESGFYDDAVRHLKDADDRRARGQSPNDDPEDLRVAKALALTHRRAGNRTTETALNEGRRLLQSHRERLGDDHQYTLAAQLSHAVELHQHSRHRSAVEEADDCLRRLGQRYGKTHPFIGIARANLATFLFADGQAPAAARNGRQAIEELCATVEESHPWVLVATVNLTRTEATIGDKAKALRLLRTAQRTCLVDLRKHHPVTRTATANLEAATMYGIKSAATDRWRDLDIDIPLI